MKRVISILLSCVILLQCTLLYASCNDDVEYQSEIDAQFELINIRETTDAEVVRYGVDVSEHQGTIDWQAVAASGIEFAFIRVGYRTYGSGLLQEDSYYYENLVGALDAGLQVGVYIYTQAINESEAVEEAEFALDLIQGFEVTLPVIIDFEFAETASGYTIGRLYEADLSIEAQTDICNAFCNTVEAAGYSSGVYASRSVLEDELDTTDLECVWMSQTENYTDYNGNYTFWQCSFNGDIPGISDSVDLNIWYDDGAFPTYTPLPFSDVSVADWSYQAIRFCYEAGIIHGKPGGLYDPQAEITRLEAITMLYRFSGLPEVDATEAISIYGETMGPALKWGIDNDILKGKVSTIHAEKLVTRQELMLFLYRLAGKPKTTYNDLSKFKDGSSVLGYYSDAVVWALDCEILCGDSSGYLNLSDILTREEAAAFLMRYIKLYS